MRKKAVSLIIIFSVLICSSYATDIEEMLAKAKSSSSVFRGYEISHSNTLLSQEQKDLSGVVFSVSGGFGAGEQKVVVSPASVSVSIPDLYKGLGLTFNTDLTQIDLLRKKSFSIKPSLSVSKDFEIKNYSDTRADIEDTKTELQTEIYYQTEIYNFENSLINAVINIMQTESRLSDAEMSYSRLEKAYNNDIYLESIQKDSLKDVEQKMNLSKTKANLDSLRVSLEKLKRDFKQQFGIDYEEITDVRDANLTFEPSVDGNGTVYIALLNLETAKQSLAAQQGHTDKLSIGGSANSSFTINGESDEANTVVGLNASATYSAKTWNVSAALVDSFGKGLSMIPSVTLSGKWSSSTTKSKSDSLNEQMLYNSVLEKENSYNSALYSYNENVQTLMRDIDSHLFDVEQLEIQTDYHRVIVEYQEKMFLNGLTTQQALDDAITNYNKDLQQALILKLQALVLENRIKTIEL